MWGGGEEAKAQSHVEALFAIAGEKLGETVHVTQNVLYAVLFALQRMLLVPNGVPHLQWKWQWWEHGGT